MNNDPPILEPDATLLPACKVEAKREGTYRQILCSSVLIGSSSMVNVIMGIIRTKVLALMLGPSGFGLMGTLTMVTDLARSVVGLGINSSGVRQIAEAVSKGDQRRIALTVIVLRRTAIVLGVIGAIGLALLAIPVAGLTFGGTEQAVGVAVVALAVFFRMVADGQGALLQGMRRIGDMAKGSVIGTIIGSVLTVALVYWLHEDGIAWSIVLGTAMSVVVMWWYSRKVSVEPLSPSGAEMRSEAGALLRLGVAFMASNLLMMGATYVVRIILIRHEGLHAAGLYQAAWTLGGLYVTFILQAMGTDFYPRLVGAIHDDEASNRLVNEQALVSLLLAGPGVIATMAFAPVAIHLFYTAEFSAAAETLRWICAGMALRVISWPMGFIIVARNAQRVFIATEAAWVVVNVGATYLFVNWWGMAGIGIAFMLSYVFHVGMIYPIVHRMSGFLWTKDNLRVGLIFGSLTLSVPMAFEWMSSFGAYAAATLTTLASCLLSLYLLAKLAAPERIHPKIGALLSRIVAFRNKTSRAS